jgi:hypothetical protein
MEREESGEPGRPESTRLSRRALDGIVQRVARPEGRSGLFWWLLEHHDELRQAAAEGGLGIPWRALCPEFSVLGITASGGKAVTPAIAKRTWQRVRRELACVEARRARERAEREARRAADQRRSMPSRFPKGEYGPPLAPGGPQLAGRSRAIASPAERLRGTPAEGSQGLQLSTANGVVVTNVSRVYKTEAATSDFSFEENGMIVAQCPRSSHLRNKQEINRRGQRHVNDRTVELKLYLHLGLRLEEL